MDSDRVEIDRITDFMIPSCIMQDKFIAERIYEDGASFKIPDLINEVWLSSKINNRIFACFRFQIMSSGVFQIHPMILKKVSYQYAIESAVMACMWCVKKYPKLRQIISVIPKKHRNVILFARQCGQSHIGTIKNAYYRDDKITDIEIYCFSSEKIIEQGAKWAE